MVPKENKMSERTYKIVVIVVTILVLLVAVLTPFVIASAKGPNNENHRQTSPHHKKPEKVMETSCSSKHNRNNPECGSSAESNQLPKPPVPPVTDVLGSDGGSKQSAPPVGPASMLGADLSSTGGGGGPRCVM